MGIRYTGYTAATTSTAWSVVARFTANAPPQATMTFTTSASTTAGNNAGYMPAPQERAEQSMGYKKPEIIPGFRAEDPDTIHLIDQIGVQIKEQRLGNLVALMEYNQKIATIFNGRQVEAIQGEINEMLWE